MKSDTLNFVAEEIQRRERFIAVKGIVVPAVCIQLFHRNADCSDLPG
jgi:hypothetical protein